jgi:hypothetical protein
LNTLLRRIFHATFGRRRKFTIQNHPQKARYPQTSGVNILHPMLDSGFLWEKYLSVLPSQETEIVGTYLSVDNRGIVFPTLRYKGSSRKHLPS